MKRKERSDGKATRAAILAVATELFAARGYELVSMREICRKVGVNSALASRYYDSKEGLYRIVAKQLFGDLAIPLINLSETVTDEATWQAAVETWVEDFLYMSIPTAPAQRLCAGLFRQEVSNPTKFHDEFSRDFGKPVYDSLRELIAMKVDDDVRIELITTSIWSQVSVFALVDKTWHQAFRPANTDDETWRQQVGDFICQNLFAEIKRV